MNLLTLVIHILKYMDITLHIKIADLASDTKDSLIWNKKIAIALSPCTRNGSDANSVIGLSQSISVEIILQGHRN